MAWLFALALDGDGAAELELGRRAFPWASGGDGGATDLEALRAYLALTQADYERHRDAPRPVLTPEERAAADQGAARARDALLARIASLTGPAR